MKTLGYVRVSTDKQAECGISLEAPADKIRAMALVQGAELSEIIVESGESAKSLNRPGMAKLLLAMVDGDTVKAVIVAMLDRLTRSVKDQCELLERFSSRFPSAARPAYHSPARPWLSAQTARYRGTPGN